MGVLRSSLRLVLCSLAPAVLVLGACQGSPPEREPLVGLEELTEAPETFDIGERLRVEGLLIRPPRSVTFICDEISKSDPPKATGHCTQVIVSLQKIPSVQSAERTRWVDHILSLDCKVKAHMPGTPPERLVLTCDSPYTAGW